MKQIIGIDLSVLDKAPLLGPSTHVHPECPGAYIRVTLADYRSLLGGKMRFVTPESEIPSDGYAEARVNCGGHVQRIPEKRTDANGEPFESIPIRYYGLCAYCSAIERVNRDTLKKRFMPEPKVGGR